MVVVVVVVIAASLLACESHNNAVAFPEVRQREFCLLVVVVGGDDDDGAAITVSMQTTGKTTVHLRGEVEVEVDERRRKKESDCQHMRFQNGGLASSPCSFHDEVNNNTNLVEHTSQRQSVKATVPRR